MTTFRTVLAAALLAAGGLSAPARGVAPAVRPPVDHPACSPVPVRSAGGWRAGVEGFGERLVTESLERRGYTVVDRKLHGNHGIDLIAVKRGPDARLTDVKLVEAKTHSGASTPRLGRTADGRQMSDGWLRTRVRALPDRLLAGEISQLLRDRGGSIGRLGEVHDVNLRHGTLTVRDARLTTVGRPVPVGAVLADVAGESPSAASRAWAGRHLASFDAIRQTRMTSWLAASPTSRGVTRVAADRIAVRWAVARGVGRSLWLVGVAVALTDEANDAYEWHAGAISRREFVTRTAGRAGGFAGAWAGGWTGAWIGGGLGTLGGPLAWLTVPAGGLLGGVIGGTIGYLAGSHLGTGVADECYRLMDEQTRSDTAARLRDSSFPLDR